MGSQHQANGLPYNHKGDECYEEQENAMRENEKEGLCEELTFKLRPETTLC